MADTNLLILAREFKTLRNHVQEVLKMPVGPQGLQGEKGEQGVKGDTGAPGKNGKDGKDGVNGVNGSNGIDGKDGEDGKDGLDGVGVQNAYIDFDNSLVIVLTSGQEINAGFLSQETKDAVVATFKQGAQTLNELLPVQTGNANKFLKTDGENVSWDTLDGSDINLASPPAIGGTTPNAATFTTLTATGALTATSTATLGGDATNPSLVAAAVAGSTRWLQVAGSASNNVTLSAQGTGSPSFVFQNRSTGPFSFTTASTLSNEQLRIAHTASAVNYVQVTGGATGSFSLISAQGSDAVTGLGITSKGAARINFFNNNGVNRQVSIGGNGAAAVNYLDFNGSAAGIAPSIGVAGTDTNISQVFQSKGTGAIDLAAGSSGVNISNGGTVTAITRTAAGLGYTSMPTMAISAPTTAGGVQATASIPFMTIQNVSSIVSGGTGYTAGDVLTISGGTVATVPVTLTVSTVSAGVITAVTISAFGSYSVLPNNPVSVTGGTGSGATFNINWGIGSSFTITNAGSGYVEQPTVTFSGGGGSGAAAYASVGSVTTIKSIGSASERSLTFQGPNGFDILQLAGDAAMTTQETLRIQPTPFGRTNVIALGGTNSQMWLSANGTGYINLSTGGTSLTTQARVTHTASAVNYVQVTGAATGSVPTISAQGSDANIHLFLNAKGTGNVFMQVAGANVFQAAGTGTSANRLLAQANNTGISPVLQSVGSDTNIDLALTPKGTGNVRFGTLTASADVPITGYIEIKDAGGTIRRLAVVA